VLKSEDDSEKEIFSDDDENVEHEVWGPYSSTSLKDYCETTNFNITAELNKLYKRINPDCDGIIDEDSLIETGSRMWSPDATVYGCSNNHREGNKRSFFVKLCLEVNVNRQNGTKIDNQNKAYYGDVIEYLKYTFPDGRSKLFGLIKIYNMKKKGKELWSYKTPSTTHKMKLVFVDEIVALCGESLDGNNREYGYTPNWIHHDFPAGNFNLI
jgi:hypothetical protein